MLNYGEQGFCIVLKCLLKDCILGAKKEKEYYKSDLNRVIKRTLSTRARCDALTGTNISYAVF